MSSSWTFLLLNLTKWRQNDVNAGICVYENLFTDSWVDVISVNFNSKKSIKMTFSSDKIYYNFSQKNPKITNI